MNIYQQLLLDHYRNPRNYGILDNPTFKSEDYNPSCGDSIAWQAIMQNNHIVALKFTGKGCVISQATASLLSQHCQGKTSEEIKSLTIDDVQALIGMQLGPMRLKCILLVLYALQKGLIDIS